MRGCIRWIAALLALAALVLIAFMMVRGATGIARLSADGGESEPDPMFAEPAERVTRPPELSGEGAPVISGDEDPSRNWVYETLTPVERTAAELANEP